MVECLQDDPDNRPTAAVLHVQLKKCMEECLKTDTHEQPIYKVSYKHSTSSIQKWFKYYRGLYGLKQKSYKIKYNMQELCRVSVTESVASSTESYFAKVLTATGMFMSLP